jgi:hypothetical protein
MLMKRCLAALLAATLIVSNTGTITSYAGSDDNDEILIIDENDESSESDDKADEDETSLHMGADPITWIMRYNESGCE